MHDLIFSPFQDVKVFSTEMESFLPSKSHAFTVGKFKGQIFIREEEVILEANFLGQDTPPIQNQELHQYQQRIHQLVQEVGHLQQELQQ